MRYLRPPRLPGGRSCRRAGAALAAAVLAALALAITGAGTALAAPGASTSNAEITPGCTVTSVSDATWMGDLASCLQDHKLSQIVIPGSHDSLTYSIASATDAGYATTQDQTITQQLNDGMRAFDIRVGWTDGLKGWGYYADHGGTYGGVTLPYVFSDILDWASAPGHQHEIIRLGVDIEQNGEAFPSNDCRLLGYTGLITPQLLQAHFGTTDPGQVTLGQLWSLPNPRNAARVIIDGSDQCMDAAAGAYAAAAGDLAAGTWTPSSAYYADWGCDPSTVSNLLVGAARIRATEGPQPAGQPISLGPPHPGGLYELDIQETPASPWTCLRDPLSLAPDQIGFLTALKNAWLDEPSVRQNLNIVLGDFIEQIPLAADAIAMDERLNSATRGWQVAWQDNTGNLWSTGFDDFQHGAWGKLMPGTSPAITTLPGGGYEMAYQDTSGHLRTVGTAGSIYWADVTIMAGTSPAITTLTGGGYEVAYQDNTGTLQSVGSGPGSGSQDWHLGMMAGTSPAITAVAGGGYEMAFQANTGILWTWGSAGNETWGLGMMAGTSPAITSIIGGQTYEVAFQANTGILWTAGFGGSEDWGLGMMAGTSPAITGLANGNNFEVAFQANTGLVWTVGSDSAIGHEGPYYDPAMAGTSPAITGLPDGGYEVVYQASNGSLRDVGTDGDDVVAAGLMQRTSPSIAAIQW
jgi:hypothetical protein